MTTGGLLAALAFVAAALVEMKIQASVPRTQPIAGQANLLLVNGLSDCWLVQPSIVMLPPSSLASLDNDASPGGDSTTPLALAASSPIKSLAAQSFDLSVDANNSTNTGQQQLNLALKFTLANTPQQANTNANTSSARNARALIDGCPFDTAKLNKLSIGAAAPNSNQLLYVEQGNGKLSAKLFNDSRAMPKNIGQARVALLYEMFGSPSQASKRMFYITRKTKHSKSAAARANNATQQQQGDPLFQFNMTRRDGQVLLSDYVDVPVSSGSGALFVLITNDDATSPLSASLQRHTIKLLPGTRNLIVLNQGSSHETQLALNVLQGNEYRISMLYQLLPYFLISASEVMFSITGLEFCYASAPETMKSLILGLWSLTTALGNLLTVAIESVHPFSNVVHDFLFYASLMAADMLIFALLGYLYYKPAPSSSPALQPSQA